MVKLDYGMKFVSYVHVHDRVSQSHMSNRLEIISNPIRFQANTNSKYKIRVSQSKITLIKILVMFKRLCKRFY